MFDENSNRFAHLATDRAMGFRIRPARSSLSENSDDSEEVHSVNGGVNESEEDDDDSYFDGCFDEHDVDENTTLRKPVPGCGAAGHSTGQVKSKKTAKNRIVNR